MREQPRVAILGVTGFIGRGLPALFTAEGWQVTGVSRQPGVATPHIQSWQQPETLDLAGYQAVINLAGMPIDRRWTEANRRLFHESRIGTTDRIVKAMASIPGHARPAVLVNASAVGVYGDRGDEWLDESSAAGIGYLSRLCLAWESAASEARALGVRVAMPRIGIVLGRDGAAFRKMLTLFRLGLGGRLGSGRQWMPWIHVDDARDAIVHAVLHEAADGPFNLCAPNPETNRDFTAKLAAALRRPAVLPVPGFALKLAFDGFGSALLAGQRARPAALQASGYRFHYPHLDDALRDLTSPDR